MKKGFTLAETLITIGIIGVVSALTIPALITNYQKQQTATLLKKTYADLKNIIRLSIVENDEPSGWKYPEDSSKAACEDFIKTYYFPFIKGGVGRIPASYRIKNLNGLGSFMPSCGFEMADGRLISFFPNINNSYIWLFADINGNKTPNRAGRDVFVFEAYTSYDVYGWGKGNSANFLSTFGVELVDRNNASGYGCSKENKYGSYAGWYCASLIMLNNWKIPKDYPW
ncbi:type II secretion system protein [bacterium]|nr:type II secretion system protein [bacterium]